MKLVAGTNEILNIKCWQLDLDQLSRFWDMASQIQKIGGHVYSSRHVYSVKYGIWFSLFSGSQNITYTVPPAFSLSKNAPATIPGTAKSRRHTKQQPQASISSISKKQIIAMY